MDGFGFTGLITDFLLVFQGLIGPQGPIGPPGDKVSTDGTWSFIQTVL